MTSVAASGSAFSAWRSTRLLRDSAGPQNARVLNLGPYDPSFVIGSCNPSSSFGTNYLNGRIALIKILKNRYDPQAMIVNGFKLEYRFSTENDDLITYFNFNSTERGQFIDNQFTFNDNSVNFKQFSGGQGSPTAIFDEVPDLPNSICLRHDTIYCKSFYTSSLATVIPDSKYLGLSTSTNDYFRIFPSKTSQIEEMDPGMIFRDLKDWHLGIFQSTSCESLPKTPYLEPNPNFPLPTSSTELNPQSQRLIGMMRFSDNCNASPISLLRGPLFSTADSSKGYSQDPYRQATTSFSTDMGTRESQIRPLNFGHLQKGYYTLCLLGDSKNLKVADIRVLGSGVNINIGSKAAKNGMRFITGGESGNFGATGNKIFLAPDCNIGLLTSMMIRETASGIQTVPPTLKTSLAANAWEEIKNWYITFEKQTFLFNDIRVSINTPSPQQMGSTGQLKVCTIDDTQGEGKYKIAETSAGFLGNGRVMEFDYLMFSQSGVNTIFDRFIHTIINPEIHDAFQFGDRLHLIECSTEGDRPHDSICNTKAKSKLADVNIAGLTSFYVGDGGVNLSQILFGAGSPSFCICHEPLITSVDLSPDSLATSTAVPMNLLRLRREWNQNPAILSKALKISWRRLNLGGNIPNPGSEVIQVPNVIDFFPKQASLSIRPNEVPYLLLDREVKFFDNDPVITNANGKVVRGRFRIFEYRLSVGCFIEESEDCRILGSESGVTRIEDTFGTGVKIRPEGLDRNLKSFLALKVTPPRTRIYYPDNIFDGFGDGNLYWSKDKGYEASKRSMWGKNWGPGFYAWQISRFSLIRTPSSVRFVFSDFMDNANQNKVNIWPDEVILNFTLQDFQIAEHKPITPLDPTGEETNRNIFINTDTIVIEGRHLEWVVYRALSPEGKLDSWSRSEAFGRSIGATEFSAESVENSPNYIPLALFTKEIKIQLYIEGDSNILCNYIDPLSGLEYPDRLIKGQVLKFNNTQIIYKTLNLNPDCKNGMIKMDISFDRVLYGGKRVHSCSAKTPFNQFGDQIGSSYSNRYPGQEINDKIKLRVRTSKRGASLGYLGCPSTCTECGRSTTTDIEGKWGCMSCLKGYYLQFGKCVKKCEDTENSLALRVKYYSSIFQQIQYQNGCTNECDAGFFKFLGKDGTPLCGKCHYRCSSCTSPVPNHCTDCFSTFKYYSGHCLRECPDGTTDQGEFCLEKIGQGKEWLEVKINKKGLIIPEDSYENQLEQIYSIIEQPQDFFSATVFYNGTSRVNSAWRLIVEDLDKTKEDQLRVQAFSNDTIRMDTLNTVINFQKISNLNFYRNRITLEVAAWVGTNYRTDYLTFRLIRRPAITQMYFPVASFNHGTDASMNIMVSPADVGDPLFLQCFLKINEKGSIFNVLSPTSVIANVIESVSLKLPLLPTYVFPKTDGNTFRLKVACIVSSINNNFKTEIVKEIKISVNAPVQEFPPQLLLTVQQQLAFLNNILTVQSYFNINQPPVTPMNICVSNVDCWGNGICVRGYCDCIRGYAGVYCRYSTIFEWDDIYAKVQKMLDQDLSIEKLNSNSQDSKSEISIDVGKTVDAISSLKGLVVSVAAAEFVGTKGVRIGLDLIGRLMTILDETNGWSIVEELIPQIVIDFQSTLLQVTNQLWKIFNFGIRVKNLYLHKDNLQNLQELLYQNIEEFQSKLSRRYGFAETGRKLESSKFGYVNTIGPNIREIYEKTPFAIKDNYLDIGMPSGEIEVEYRTVRRTLENTPFKSDLGDILGNTGLERVHLFVQNTDLLISDKLLLTQNQILLDMSLVVLKVTTYKTNPALKYYENIHDVLHGVKEISLYNSDGTKLNISDSSGLIEFSVNSYILQNNELDADQLACGVWERDNFTEYSGVYNMSLDIGVFDLHDFEQKDNFDFIPTFNLEKDFVTFSKQMKFKKRGTTLKKEGCSTRLQNSQIYCRCNHLSMFSVRVNHMDIFDSVLSRMQDTNTDIDFKIKRSFFQTLSFKVIFPLMCIHLIVVLCCICKYRKDMEYRRRTILEYVKFLLLWRKRKDIFEGDITSLKEKVDEMKMKRIEYFNRVSKAKDQKVQNEQLIEHAIGEDQKDVEFPAFYVKEAQNINKEKEEWGEEEKEIEDRDLVQQHLSYKDYIQHKNFDEFNNPEIYDIAEVDGELKKLREQKISLLQNFKKTGDTKFDDKFISELKLEIKRLDRKTGLDSREILQKKEGREYEFKLSSKKFVAKEADAIVTKVQPLEYQKNEDKIELEKQRLRLEIQEIIAKYSSPITKEKIEPETADFLKNILPKELLTRDMKDLMNVWPDTLDVIYEMHMFSTSRKLKDKSSPAKFISRKNIFFLTNPILNIFFKNYSFITPPIVRLHAAFITIYIHLMVNGLIFMFMSPPRYEKDEDFFYPYDVNENLLKTLAGLAISMILCYFLTIVIFVREDSIKIPRTIKEIEVTMQNSCLGFQFSRKDLQRQTNIQMAISLGIYLIISFGSLIICDLMIQKFGHITGFNWLQSSLLTIVIDVFAIDFSLTLLMLKAFSLLEEQEEDEQKEEEEEDKDPLNPEAGQIEEDPSKSKKKGGRSGQNKLLQCLNVINWIGSAANWLKRIRTVSYDGWLTVSSTAVHDRDFVYLSHLLDEQYNVVFNQFVNKPKCIF